jgi:hypothetical protein
MELPGRKGQRKQKRKYGISLSIRNPDKGKIAGKKPRRRPRKRYFEDIQDPMNCRSFHEMEEVCKKSRRVTDFTDKA